MNALRDLAIGGLLAGLLTLCFPVSLDAQSLPQNPAVSSDEDTTADDSAVDSETPSLEQRRADLEQRRRSLEALGDARRRAALDHLDALEHLLDQQAAALDRGRLLADREVSEDPFGDPAGYFDHPPPFTVAELDAILDALATEEGALISSQQAAEASQQAAESASKGLEDVERRRRLARDTADEGDPTILRTLRGLDRAVELATEEDQLRQLHLANAQLALEQQEQKVEVLRNVARATRSRVIATPRELETILAQLRRETSDLGGQLDNAERRAEAAEATWRAAEQRLAGAADNPTVLAMERARRFGWETAEAARQILIDRKERATVIEWLWTQRFQILGQGMNGADLRILESELAAEMVALERDESIARARIDELESTFETLRQRRQGRPSASVDRWLEELEKQLSEQLDLHREELERLGRARRLAERLEAAVQGQELGFDERLEQFRNWTVWAWNYEITTADDQSITVGKVVITLFVLFLGYAIAKRITGHLGQVVLPRLGIESGIAAAYQTLAFYALMVIFLLYALRLVNIPLTVFTVLGGVVAIGVGFGSQNIVNNFISGLILLTERPIKVGDLVDVAGLQGIVERIGLRSVHILSGDNTHMIVPNSAFLETNVRNWTMSDNRVRTSIDIGVAYGSPIRQVESILMQGMADEERILKHPEPEVLFVDFGDSALVFRALFWVRIRAALDTQRVESRLRFRLDELLADAEITIPFPQQDVHFDPKVPLSVHMIEAAKADGKDP